MKAYTDLEQSKKLAEILPLESADMCYLSDESLFPKINYNGMVFFNSEEEKPSTIIPCWSLAALLNYLREIDFFPEIAADEHIVTMNICYYDEDEGELLNPVHDITTKAETFVDACYDMIIKLNGLNLL